ncbi:MAG: glycosyltransferase [Candidatus Pacearchaeota archaeon]|jgi:glycosyltransferase involved in cell wall biosynthesis
MLSIIIPTKNEGKYLGLLLKSIKNQSFKNFEIIVADANSKDNTKEIAKKYGCKIVKGGMPWTGRNNGAKIAEGDFFVFIDADVVLPEKNFVENCLKEISERNLDVAGVLLKPRIDKKKHLLFFYKLIYSFLNFLMKISQNSKSPLMQNCMFSKKNIYTKINGFDETLVYAEDSDYARRAVNKIHAKFGIINKKIYVSTRRLEEKGFKLIFKVIYMAILRNFKELRKKNSKIRYFD